MKLSEISTINKKNLINEKEFETLGILASKSGKTMCTFIDDEKYLKDLKDEFVMVMTTKEIYDQLKNRNCGFYITEKPRIEFFALHNQLAESHNYARERFKTKIGNNCHISDKASISSENVIIGDNVTIEEFVSIKDNVVIGDNSIIRSGTVLGSVGFEFKRIEDKIMPIEHVGGVVIGTNVEIQYNSTVDKAIYPWDDTVIGDYTKIDNLNHIGHACKIGKAVMIPAGSTIGGRVEIGDNTWIGIGSVIRNGMVIGKNARANMGAVITKNVADGEAVSGNFAIKHEIFINNIKKWNNGI